MFRLSSFRGSGCGSSQLPASSLGRSRFLRVTRDLRETSHIFAPANHRICSSGREQPDMSIQGYSHQDLEEEVAPSECGCDSPECPSSECTSSTCITSDCITATSSTPIHLVTHSKLNPS